MQAQYAVGDGYGEGKYVVERVRLSYLVVTALSNKLIVYRSSPKVA